MTYNGQMNSNSPALPMESPLLRQHDQARTSLETGHAKFVTVTGAAGSGISGFVLRVKRNYPAQVRTLHVGSLIRDELQKVIDIVRRFPEDTSMGTLLAYALDAFRRSGDPISGNALPALMGVVGLITDHQITFRQGKNQTLRMPRLEGYEFVLFKRWENEVRRFHDNTFWGKKTLEACIPTLAFDRSVFVTGVNWIGDLAYLQNFGLIAIRFDAPSRVDSSVFTLPEHKSMSDTKAYDLVIDTSRTPELASHEAALAFLTR